LLGDTRRQLQGVLTALSTLVADRQSGYRTHAAEVANLSVAVGAAQGMTEEETESLRHAALLHDVGLLSVPVDLINASRRLTDEERATVESHAVRGAELAGGANFDESVQQAILAHHERLDGSGYPRQLRGLEIPLAARIIAVCDSYDAMTHERPNTQRLRPFEAMAEIRRGAGSLYDPKVVNGFSAVVEQRVQLAKIEAESA
jgi:putative nucleotidyltransferase with HDIG domain